MLAIYSSDLAVKALTNDIDGAADDNGPLATNDVGDITSNEGTKEGSSRENGDDERGVVAGNGASTAGGVQTLRADGTLDLLNEERGVEDTVDVTRIITVEHLISYIQRIGAASSLPEEDTTEGSKSTEHVSLPGDRCLSHVDISCGIDGVAAKALLLLVDRVRHVGG